MAWVGTAADRPATLLTLQAALNAVPVGGTVSFDSNDYAFTTALTVPRQVTLETASASTLFARFTISGGGLTAAETVRFGVAATPVFSVTGNDVTLSDLRVSNPNAVARPTGVQLGAGVTGTSITNFAIDGGGQASSYGINLSTGAATITNSTISGVATGIGITAAATTAGISVTGGTITSATAGIALGATASPRVTGTTLIGPGAAGTGIDLQNASAAVISDVQVSSFNRGIGTTGTSAAAGATITNPTIIGAGSEGISLGSTSGASITGATITGAGAGSSRGVNIYRATGVTITEPTVGSFAYGIYTDIGDTGAGPRIIRPTITAVTGGITLGSTQGATITDSTITGSSSSGTGINFMNAGRVTVRDGTITGMLYGVGTTSQLTADSDRTDIVISRITVVGAPNASNAVTLLGVTNTRISDVVAEIAGAGVITHDSSDVTVTGVDVTGRPGISSTSGAAVLRAYDSQRVNLSLSSINGGSYGVFYSSSTDSVVTGILVENVSEYGIYARSSADLNFGTSIFRNNGAVGNIVVTVPSNGISHDVRIHDNTMTDNRGGVNLSAGTRAVRFTDNVVTGQPAVLTAAPAHDVTIAGNTVTQTADDATAVIVVPTYEDGEQPGSYSSSGITVRDNRFVGAGMWIRVGSPPDSVGTAFRTVQDPVLVVGNTFPADSTAIRTFPNAVVGEDTAGAVDRAGAARAAASVVVPNGPVAVDARNHGNPNDWASPCKATGYLDDDLRYDGGGAAVYELTVAPVLYPENCVDLSLTETPTTPTGTSVRVGDTVTWTLTPHNDGPGAAPAGWTVTQLLPDGVTVVSMTGDGYRFAGTTGTAEGPLPSGADGSLITVTVRIGERSAATLHDVAFVALAAAQDVDGDGYDDPIIERTNPLVVPTVDTDAIASPTDNDADGVWTIAADEPTPGGGGGGEGGGGGDRDADGVPSGSGIASTNASDVGFPGGYGPYGEATTLAWTGVSLAAPFAAAVVLLIAGTVTGLIERRRRRTANHRP
ncbi:uncharacterized protein DUF11 [Curtobacterium sp. PhB115]|nr:uncharacterized protein DUF11 [Curtobacterium sp. PhB115]